MELHSPFFFFRTLFFFFLFLFLLLPLAHCLLPALSAMNTLVMVAHAIIGGVSVSGLLAIALLVRRTAPFDSQAFFWSHAAVLGLALAGVTTAFVLGFVWVGGSVHFSLTTPTRGTHSVTGLIVMVVSFLIGLIRLATLRRDVSDRHEGSYRAYDQMAVVVLLMGIICVYTGFADYAVVDSTYDVTQFYWIYSIFVGIWVVVFAVIETVKFRRHQRDYALIRAEELEAERSAAEMAVAQKEMRISTSQEQFFITRSASKNNLISVY